MPKVKFILLLFFASLVGQQVVGQMGGYRSFSFLNRPISPRLAALGHVNVSTYGDDPALIEFNPALLNPTMDRHALIAYSPMPASITSLGAFYAHNLGKEKTLGFGIQNINYGTFYEYDVAGNYYGETFTAGDMAFAGTYAVKSGNFRLGATAKFLHSYIGAYSSSAVATDIGGLFKHPDRDFNVGLAFKNLGFAFDPFDQTNTVLPINIQAGFSYKLEHMPLRFSATAQQLQQWDLSYTPTNGPTNATPSKPSAIDLAFRHMVFGGEFIFSKNFNARLGYNHLIRRDMALENASGGAGFSLGAMLRVKSFEFAYTHAFIHPAGGVTYLSIMVDVNKLLNRNQVTETQSEAKTEGAN